MARPPVGLPPAPNLTKEGYQLILDFEVGGGKSYYNRFLKHIEWPGYSSGLTGGIGYDWGQNSKSVALSDWKTWNRQDWSNRLANTSGITGIAAKQILYKYKEIFIEWTLAEKVFNDVTIARYWQLCQRTFPGFDKLKPNAQAAVLSCVFNRGASTSGPSRKEVRDLKEAIATQDYKKMAAAFRGMKRLWPANPNSDRDLTDRREDEAKLTESCLY